MAKRIVTLAQDKTTSEVLYRKGSTYYPFTSTELPGVGGGGTATLQTATVTLTDAQIKALPTTPVNILPDVSASQQKYALFGGNITFDIITPYTNIAVVDTANGISPGFMNDGFGIIPSGFFGAGILNNINKSAIALSVLTRFFLASDPDVINGVGDANRTKSVEGCPYVLEFAAENFTENYGTDLGDFTGGNAANYMKVTVYYSIVDL
ncbi:MAG TPA: hypothetical protein VMY77_03185 [Chitinophagaceae bacterium]|nr:hypothetical protein [Chitinophagaceae bacterium]